MNNELFKLAFQGLKRKRKSSFLLLIVLTLSFAFALIMLSISSSMAVTNEAYRQTTFGLWQAGIPDGDDQDGKFLSEQSYISEIGTARSCGKLIGAFKVPERKDISDVDVLVKTRKGVTLLCASDGLEISNRNLYPFVFKKTV